MGDQVWNGQSDVPHLFSIVWEHYMSVNYTQGSSTQALWGLLGKAVFKPQWIPPTPTHPSPQSSSFPKALAAVSVGGPFVCLQSSFFLLLLFPQTRMWLNPGSASTLLHIWIRSESKVSHRVVLESTSSSCGLSKKKQKNPCLSGV